MTRIIAGAARGRRIAVPPAGTRPTADRVRESLFGSLDSALGSWSGVRVLDLYAGSGALGLEALSRGASHVLLVERNSKALQVLRANVAHLGLPGAEVRPGEVARVLAAAADEPYDVVLADPPYDLAAADLVEVLQALAGGGWLAEAAIVVVERARRGGFDWPGGYRPGRERSYGDTILRHGVWYGRDAPP